LTSAAPTILKTLGKKPGDIIVAGFDLSSDTVAGIKNGYIGLVSDQQPYLQGFLPILQSCLTKKYGLPDFTLIQEWVLSIVLMWILLPIWQNRELGKQRELILYVQIKYPIPVGIFFYQYAN